MKVGNLFVIILIIGVVVSASGCTSTGVTKVHTYESYSQDTNTQELDDGYEGVAYAPAGSNQTCVLKSDPDWKEKVDAFLNGTTALEDDEFSSSHIRVELMNGLKTPIVVIADHQEGIYNRFVSPAIAVFSDFGVNPLGDKTGEVDVLVVAHGLNGRLHRVFHPKVGIMPYNSSDNSINDLIIYADLSFVDGLVDVPQYFGMQDDWVRNPDFLTLEYYFKFYDNKYRRWVYYKVTVVPYVISYNFVKRYYVKPLGNNAVLGLLPGDMRDTAEMYLASFVGSAAVSTTPELALASCG
ncbi:hypothetical protein [Thermococcus camini]|uniref:Uncharacterized protein n=1 Tax=Thermococcus camini TaxID=2016373 RepID=A0A7G2DCI3_9EURY|nr:hypothetical protein [Thermococcus camini]CAD5245265.1 exported protein of unknown function [Thermococcus camini]